MGYENNSWLQWISSCSCFMVLGSLARLLLNKIHTFRHIRIKIKSYYQFPCKISCCQKVKRNSWIREVAKHNQTSHQHPPKNISVPIHGGRSAGGKLPAELLIKPPIRLSLSPSLSSLAHTQREKRITANREARRRSDGFPWVAEVGDCWRREEGKEWGWDERTIPRSESRANLWFGIVV